MPHEPDWYDDLSAALASRQIDSARIDGIVAEARAHCAETAESPPEAFGDAATYARRITSADDPEEMRFQQVAERHTATARPAFYRLLFWIGASLAGVGTFGWLVSGTRHTLTAYDLAFWITYFLSIPCIQLRSDARDAGRPSTDGGFCSAVWSHWPRVP